MNWIEIIIIIIIGLSGLRAYSKGFLQSLFSVFSLIITIVLTIQLFPIGSQMIAEHTSLNERIEDSVSTALQLDQQTISQTTREEEMSFINNLPLPEAMKENLLVNNNQEVYQLLGATGLTEYISSYIARIAINIISFLIIFIVIYVLILIGVRVLDLISKLPILNTVNKLLGLLFGLMMGVIQVWFIFLILTFFSTNTFVGEVFARIEASEIASFLYNHNLLLEAILDLTKIIF